MLEGLKLCSITEIETLDVLSLEDRIKTFENAPAFEIKQDFKVHNVKGKMHIGYGFNLE